MFPFTRCSEPGCQSFTCGSSSFCYHHSPQDVRERVDAELRERLVAGSHITDLAMVNAEIRGITAGEGLRLTGCTFSFSIFEGCAFRSSSIISCFFDYCFFHDCTFTDMDIRYSVFAGSSFVFSRINDSTVIHNNFMGVDAIDSDFSGNDFYFSNFSLSRLIDTDMEDANLKRTNFRGCTTRGVSLRYSNPEEAFFRKDDEGAAR